MGYSSSPLERASLFGRALYDLTDNVQAFVQANYSQVEVDSIGPWTLAIVASAATIPHGTGIYAPSIAAGPVGACLSNCTNLAYLAGRCLRSELRAHGRLHELASLPCAG